MPECAPLAVPYVPFQQTNPKRYSQQDALNNGTLFPGLNLPFRVKPDAAKVMGGALAVLSLCSGITGLTLGVNPLNALVLGILGAPGLALLCALNVLTG